MQIVWANRTCDYLLSIRSHHETVLKLNMFWYMSSEHKHGRKVKHTSDVSIEEEQRGRGRGGNAAWRLSEVNRLRERGRGRGRGTEGRLKRRGVTQRELWSLMVDIWSPQASGRPQAQITACCPSAAAQLPSHCRNTLHAVLKYEQHDPVGQLSTIRLNLAWAQTSNAASAGRTQEPFDAKSSAERRRLGADSYHSLLTASWTCRRARNSIYAFIGCQIATSQFHSTIYQQMWQNISMCTVD